MNTLTAAERKLLTDYIASTDLIALAYVLTLQKGQLEGVMRAHYQQSAKDICNALLEHALRQDEHLRQVGEPYRIDDKTVFIIKRN